jgi:hypothetical protein
LGRRGDVEVVGSTVNLVVLGTTLELSVVYLTELYSLDGIIGVEGVRDPVVAVVVGTTLNLRLIPDRLTLLLAALEDACSSHWWTLGSSILSYVASNVLLLVAGYVDNVVGSVTVALAATLGGCTTLFSPPPYSAMGGRGALLLLWRWRGCTDLLRE